MAAWRQSSSRASWRSTTAIPSAAQPSLSQDNAGLPGLVEPASRVPAASIQTRPRKPARDFDRYSRPSLYRANRRASPSAMRSGGRAPAWIASAAARPARPNSRHRVRQRQSQSPPAAAATAPAVGMGGNRRTAPGHAATVSAVSSTVSIPASIAASGQASRPSGMASTARIAAGMIQNAASGTATRFAASP